MFYFYNKNLSMTIAMLNSHIYFEIYRGKPSKRTIFDSKIFITNEFCFKKIYYTK